MKEKMSIEEFSTCLLGGGIDNRDKIFREIQDLINNRPDTTVFILGAKLYAVHMTSIIQKKCNVANIKYVLEDSKTVNEVLVDDTKIISMSDFMDNHADYDILISGSIEFAKRYKSSIKHLYIINYAWVNDEMIRWDIKFIKHNIEQYYETYGMFSDEISRNTMIEFIHASLTGNVNKLYELEYKNQYFNDLLRDYEVKTYIDCGAFDGDTVSEFVDFFTSYDQIIAIEPDNNNFEKLESRIQNKRIKNIRKIKAGVYYYNGELQFENCLNASARYVKPDGNLKIKVNTIDSLKLKNVSLIKMDIEGSELDALRGARNTIKKFLPAMAICVYHKMEDLICIPQYISDLISDKPYNFYLRNHASNLTELVFYAIPKSLTKDKTAKNSH